MSHRLVNWSWGDGFRDETHDETRPFSPAPRSLLVTLLLDIDRCSRRSILQLPPGHEHMYSESVECCVSS